MEKRIYARELIALLDAMLSDFPAQSLEEETIMSTKALVEKEYDPNDVILVFT